MADNSMTFSNTLMQLGGEDFLRELILTRHLQTAFIGCRIDGYLLVRAMLYGSSSAILSGDHSGNTLRVLCR